ncbi:MAG TPA: MoxR family ATPase [Spirochaetota bacterium]|nr:MoxR family ATPase [Spirochaetota bacterium]HOL56391.1 MoxR family ATPase [Spirochaetota bacterium]HPP04631.1 MoxR family ATPase [Spirochaetota bacterium]
MNKKKPEDFYELYNKITDELSKVVKGQKEVIKFVVIALLTDGHILLEGFPGLGKTLIANALSRIISANFKRIQFTPDLMPSDIIGTTIFNYERNEFIVKKGPVFTNFLLADEINRTPPKTQSALLEAMQERQVTIDGNIYKLEEPFITIATQNPVELEGTYPLPEAQLDRFMFKILIDYPSIEEEKEILLMHRDGFNSGRLDLTDLNIVCSREDFIQYKNSLDSINVDEKIINYIMEIIDASRKDSNIEVGASPRGSIYLLKSARAIASINGRDFVVPDDVRESTYPVLRHRIILQPEAEIEGHKPDDFIDSILDRVKVPR